MQLHDAIIGVLGEAVERLVPLSGNGLATKAGRGYVVHDRAGGTLGSFYSIGSRAFQHDLIEIAGGVNLFADVDVETFQPSLEEVIRRKPDIILETLSPPLDPREAAQRKKDWERLGLVEDRIYIEGETYLLVPGPRFGLAAQRISEIVRGL